MLVAITIILLLVIYLDIIMPTLFIFCPPYRKHVEKIVNKFLT